MFGGRKDPHSGMTTEQLRHHYEVEKRIADKLRCSSREERIQIMRTMYDELFAQVPYHPRLTDSHDPARHRIHVSRQMQLVKHHLRGEHTFLEFGPGTCDFAYALCSQAACVYAVDICEQANSSSQKPENFKFIVYDGSNLDLPDNGIDIVFSNQMIEHMHPDDTEDHFRLVHRLLKPNGVYVLCTPERLCGPSDVSRHFSDVAEGFHLKEWTYKELGDLVKSIGFSRWKGYWHARGLCFRMPRRLILALERVMGFLPTRVRRRLGRYLLPDITMVVLK